MSTPVRPADRYGDRKWNRRWLIPVAAVAILAAVAAMLVIMRFADGQIRSSLISYERTADDVMAATLEVIRRPDREIVCDVVAVDLRQVIVGQVEVAIPASDERRVAVSIDIPVRGDAVAAEIKSCLPRQDPTSAR